MFDDTRADWGALRPSGPVYSVPASTRAEFFNHYDGGHPLGLAKGPHSACLVQVKADQQFHMHGNGWSDIGYNGLVCQHGRAIEGRGIDTVGAHCPDHNRSGYGWQFMVGGSESPTPAAYARMRRAYDDCVKRSGPLAKKGHRDGYATACPGDIIIKWVRAGMPARTGEDEVDAADIKAAVKAALHELTVRDVAGQPVPFDAALGYTLRNTQAIGALVKAQDIDADALAAAVVAQLPHGVELTAHDVAAQLIAQLAPKVDES